MSQLPPGTRTLVDQESLPSCSPDVHYQIGQGKKFYWNLEQWLAQNRDDMAVKVRSKCIVDKSVLPRLAPGLSLEVERTYS